MLELEDIMQRLYAWSVKHPELTKINKEFPLWGVLGENLTGCLERLEPPAEVAGGLIHTKPDHQIIRLTVW